MARLTNAKQALEGMSHDERRNLNPHAEARLAIVIWSEQYAYQNLGCMDWYDSLPDARKRKCRMALDVIAGLPRENK